MRAATHLNLIVAGNSSIEPLLEGQPAGQGSVREIEFKFLVNETAFKTIQESALLISDARRPAAQRLHSVYFDTEGGDLRRHRIVLRVRRLRGRYVLTLKWDSKSGSAPFERGEIEVIAPSAVPDPALLGPAVEAEIIRVTEGRPLQPVFATDIRKAVRRIIVGANEMEAAFDDGFIVSGTQKAPVREIELELKTGDPADLYQFGLSLLDDFPLRLGIMTKAERGVLLSCGAHVMAVRAGVTLLVDQTVDQAIAGIISGCVVQFVANWPAFEGPDKAEAVHQMRVAMRRLRAALGLFNRRFPCAEFLRLRGDAKRVASAMGAARNWDVFEGLLRDGPCAAFPSKTGFEALI